MALDELTFSLGLAAQPSRRNPSQRPKSTHRAIVHVQVACLSLRPSRGSVASFLPPVQENPPRRTDGNAANRRLATKRRYPYDYPMVRRSIRPRPHSRPMAVVILAMLPGLTGCTINGDPAELRRADAGTKDAATDVEADSASDSASDAEAGADVAVDAPDGAADGPADVGIEVDSAPTGSCETAVDVVLGPVGEAVPVVVDVVGAEAELAGSCGGQSSERVLRLEPSADTTVLLTAGGDGSFDPVLYVRTGNCDGASVELACQAGPPGTQLMVELEASHTYFVVVDTDGAAAKTSTVVTLLRLM